MSRVRTGSDRRGCASGTPVSVLPILRKDLIAPPADAPKVLPPVRVVLRGVYTAAADHMGAHRSFVEVRQGNDDFERSEGPVLPP